MKRITSLLAGLLLMCSFLTANATVNDKVLKAFNHAFPSIQNPTWYEHEDFYEVYFKTEDMTCRIKYDLDGDIMSTRRDYNEKSLCPFIKARINEKYPGKKIFGVTETMSGDQTGYVIVLEDNNYWYNIKSDATGQMAIDRKLKKG